MQDWIDDLKLAKTSIYPGCTGCLVHLGKSPFKFRDWRHRPSTPSIAGFYESYLALSTQMYAAFKRFNAKSAPAILITGHR